MINTKNFYFQFIVAEGLKKKFYANSVNYFSNALEVITNEFLKNYYANWIITGIYCLLCYSGFLISITSAIKIAKSLKNNYTAF